jgi:hypothetical protein
MTLFLVISDCEVCPNWHSSSSVYIALFTGKSLASALLDIMSVLFD